VKMSNLAAISPQSHLALSAATVAPLHQAAAQSALRHLQQKERERKRGREGRKTRKEIIETDQPSRQHHLRQLRRIVSRGRWRRRKRRVLDSRAWRTMTKIQRLLRTRTCTGTSTTIKRLQSFGPFSVARFLISSFIVRIIVFAATTTAAQTQLDL
jgi:hypothetical protein